MGSWNHIFSPAPVIAISLTLVSGCASDPAAPTVPHVFKHELVRDKPEKESAILKTVDGDFKALIGRCVGDKKSDANHVIYVSDYYHSTKITHYMIDVFANEAHLPPGRYVCGISCTKGNVSATPVTVLNLRAGATTALRCDSVDGKKVGIHHMGLKKTPENYFARQAEMITAGKLRYDVRNYK